MNTGLLAGLTAEWRADAEVLRRRGAVPQADVLESVASDLEARLQDWLSQELSIADAAIESGYSEDHLRDLVRTGRLPDRRSDGSEGRIHVRRCELPRKVPGPASTADIVRDMAMELAR